jgi:hypothetical protein
MAKIKLAELIAEGEVAGVRTKLAKLNPAKKRALQKRIEDGTIKRVTLDGETYYFAIKSPEDKYIVDIFCIQRKLNR